MIENLSTKAKVWTLITILAAMFLGTEASDYGWWFDLGAGNRSANEQKEIISPDLKDTNDLLRAYLESQNALYEK